MSERFVRGWSVDPDALSNVVGSKVPTKKVVASAGKQAKAVSLTLGQGDRKRGDAVIAVALEDIVRGELDPNKARIYRRVTELCLSSLGTPCKGEINLILTNGLPNAKDPRWNPVLKKLGLPKLAALWHTANVNFPWGKRVPSNGTEWPVRTQVPAKQLPAIARELASIGARAIRELSPGLLVSKHQLDWLKETQDELIAGLQTLEGWVHATKGGQDLVLIIDGDE